jgi:hypothetical protein
MHPHFTDITSWESVDTTKILTYFGKCPIQISASTPTILFEGFSVFPQPLQSNFEIVPEIGSRSLPVLYSSLSNHSTLYDPRPTWFNKLYANKKFWEELTAYFPGRSERHFIVGRGESIIFVRRFPGFARSSF